MWKSLSARTHEPDWLRQMRLDAWDLYESLPMPTTADEAWRRTDYRHINWSSAGPLSQSAPGRYEDIPAANRQPLLGDEQGALLAFVDDQLVHHETHPSLEKQGVIFHRSAHRRRANIPIWSGSIC